MTTRVACITTVTIALVLGSTGIALAETQPPGTDNAAGVQYQPGDNGTVPVVPPPAPPTDQAPAPVPQSAPSLTPAAETPEETPAVVPAPTPDAPTEEAPTDRPPPTRPVVNVETPATPAVAQAASADQASLPVTGYEVLPVALGGLALLALGAALRHQTRNRER